MTTCYYKLTAARIDVIKNSMSSFKTRITNAILNDMLSIPYIFKLKLLDRDTTTNHKYYALYIDTFLLELWDYEKFVKIIEDEVVNKHSKHKQHSIDSKNCYYTRSAKLFSSLVPDLNPENKYLDLQLKKTKNFIKQNFISLLKNLDELHNEKLIKSVVDFVISINPLDPATPDIDIIILFNITMSIAKFDISYEWYCQDSQGILYDELKLINIIKTEHVEYYQKVKPIFTAYENLMCKRQENMNKLIAKEAENNKIITDNKFKLSNNNLSNDIYHENADKAEIVKKLLTDNIETHDTVNKNNTVKSMALPSDKSILEKTKHEFLASLDMFFENNWVQRSLSPHYDDDNYRFNFYKKSLIIFWPALSILKWASKSMEDDPRSKILYKDGKIDLEQKDFHDIVEVLVFLHYPDMIKNYFNAVIINNCYNYERTFYAAAKMIRYDEFGKEISYCGYVEVGCDAFNTNSAYTRLWHLRFKERSDKLPFSREFNVKNDNIEFLDNRNKFSKIIYETIGLNKDDRNVICIYGITEFGNIVLNYYREETETLYKTLILYKLSNMKFSVIKIRTEGFSKDYAKQFNLNKSGSSSNSSN